MPSVAMTAHAPATGVTPPVTGSRTQSKPRRRRIHPRQPGARLRFLGHVDTLVTQACKKLLQPPAAGRAAGPSWTVGTTSRHRLPERVLVHSFGKLSGRQLLAGRNLDAMITQTLVERGPLLVGAALTTPRCRHPPSTSNPTHPLQRYVRLRSAQDGSEESGACWRVSSWGSWVVGRDGRRRDRRTSLPPRL
jgi:hypothetical protein